MKSDLENEVNKKIYKSYNPTTGFELTTYAIRPEHLVHWATWAVSRGL